MIWIINAARYHGQQCQMLLMDQVETVEHRQDQRKFGGQQSLSIAQKNHSLAPTFGGGQVHDGVVADTPS